MKVETNLLPLNSIHIDPELTPDALEVTNVATADEQIVRGYIEILHDYAFTEYIRVWRDQNQYFLVENYACFKGHQTVHADNPNQNIDCIVLSDATKEQVLEHSSRMRELSMSKLDSHLSRVLSLKLLLMANSALTYEDFKRFRNVIGKAQSEEGRKLDRDYKIAISDHFFCGLMGIADLKAKPLKPNLDHAIYRYGFCANELVRILGTDTKAITVFHEKYQEYIEDVRLLRSHPPDYDGKPIYQWTDIYDSDHVVALAEAAARDEGVVTQTRGEDNDQEWKIDRTTSHDIRLPAFRFNQRNIDTRNIKRLAEFEYKSQIMYFSARSHLKRIKPFHHGGFIQVKSKDIDPNYESPMNNLEFDSPYFDWVRKSFMLSYCVRWRLLKSIGLRVEYFGFPDYKPASTTTFTDASAQFNDWYQSEFIGKMVFKSRSGQVEQHPRYRIYFSIKNILEFNVLEEIQKYGPTPQPITFKDFCNKVFRSVFESLDLEDKVIREKGRALYDAFGDTSPDELKEFIEFLAERRSQNNNGNEVLDVNPK